GVRHRAEIPGDAALSSRAHLHQSRSLLYRRARAGLAPVLLKTGRAEHLRGATQLFSSLDFGHGLSHQLDELFLQRALIHGNAFRAQVTEHPLDKTPVARMLEIRPEKLLG